MAYLALSFPPLPPSPPPGFPPNSCPACLNSPTRHPSLSNTRVLNSNRANCLIGGRYTVLAGCTRPDTIPTRYNVVDLSGDFRTNENVLLGGIQTLFFREHNLIADALAAANRDWSGDVVFEEARRINTAQYQHILYNEFLPKLIGELSYLTSHVFSALHMFCLWQKTYFTFTW